MSDGLEVHDLCKRYGNVIALDQMSLDVHPGELFGFVGSNGAGKSTTMRIVLGVLAADSGTVTWQGRKISVEDRRQIGYMPEERGLYPRMKVGEQLLYLARLHGVAPAAAREAVREWTTRLGVADRVDDDVQKLSLGNQQRVQLAAALVHSPRILVLDEPFSGLDPLAVDVMSQVLRDTCDRGVPVIFSSHQLDLVERLCDRVGIVRRGSTVAVGTVDELRADASSRLVVDAPQAPAGWAGAIPGVTDHGIQDGRTVLELAADADDQQVLKAALATGPVHEFSRRRPSLVELFRHVVSEQPVPDPTKETA